MISTDKAINPTNVMGATKRLAEIYLQSLTRHSRTKPSSWQCDLAMSWDPPAASFPILKANRPRRPGQSDPPGDDSLLHDHPGSVGLVLQSATQGVGGEIFVLDMGNPVKIVDLARQLIELSGLKLGR